MSLGWLRCIQLQLELAALAVQMLHLSFVKVSLAVTAGANDHVFLPCFEWSLTASFLSV